MTVGEIKKNALAIMFANYETDLANVDVDTLTDEEYTKYTVNMNACINRALKRIERACVLPNKTIVINKATAGEIGTYLARYNLASLTNDMGIVQRVSKEDGYGRYSPCVDFCMEGDIIILPALAKSDTYRVMYQPKVKRLALTAVSSTEIDIPDEVAEIIPYFIKAELYEEDEPSMAANARNIFEATLDSLRRDEYEVQTSVANIYGGLQ